MSGQITYNIRIVVNGRILNRVIIDQHYKNKHSGTINDLLILELAKQLDGRNIQLEGENEMYQYFSVEPMFLFDKPYRLVVTICVFDDFLGVINAFRIKRRRYD